MKVHFSAVTQLVEKKFSESINEHVLNRKVPRNEFFLLNCRLPSE